MKALHPKIGSLTELRSIPVIISICTGLFNTRNSEYKFKTSSSRPSGLTLPIRTLHCGDRLIVTLYGITL